MRSSIGRFDFGDGNPLLLFEGPSHISRGRELVDSLFLSRLTSLDRSVGGRTATAWWGWFDASGKPFGVAHSRGVFFILSLCGGSCVDASVLLSFVLDI